MLTDKEVGDLWRKNYIVDTVYGTVKDDMIRDLIHKLVEERARRYLHWSNAVTFDKDREHYLDQVRYALRDFNINPQEFWDIIIK